MIVSLHTYLLDVSITNTTVSYGINVQKLIIVAKRLIVQVRVYVGQQVRLILHLQSYMP